MWAAEWRKENNLCNDTRILEVAKNNNNKKKNDWAPPYTR